MSEEEVNKALRFPDCGEDLRQKEILVMAKLTVSPERIVKGMGEDHILDVYDLIVGLEQEVGWWALTILLSRYFARQMELAQQHCPELCAKSDDELIKEIEESE